MSYCKIIIVGSVGNDAELRYAPSGSPLANFSVATNRRYKVGEENKEETAWFRVTSWQKNIENLVPYILKGTQILVEGQLVPDESGGPKIWTDKEGKPRASFEVRADTIRLLGSKKKQETEEAF